MIASQYIATLLLIMLNLARVDAGEAKLVRDPFLDLRAQVRAETLCVRRDSGRMTGILRTSKAAGIRG